MYIISLSIAKGGTGKTTSTINIASIFADNGKSCLIIDMDFQGNSSSFFVDSPDNNNDISDVLLHNFDINKGVVSSNFPNIDILPNYCKEDLEKIKINDFVNREQTLKEKINTLKKKYDYIFIDCPPALDSFTLNAFVASTHILIPIKADSSAYLGLSRLFDKTKIVKDIYNSNLKILGIFSIEKENLRVYKETMKLLTNSFESLVFKTSIRRSKDVPESSYIGKPLIKSAPYANPTFDYKKLVKEIEKRLCD